MRIEVTFKGKEKELYDYLNKKTKYISKSGYIKHLIAKDKEEEKKDKK